MIFGEVEVVFRLGEMVKSLVERRGGGGGMGGWMGFLDD
jgi:hypothetical protein